MIDAAPRMRNLLLSGDDLGPRIRNRQPAVAALFCALHSKRTFGVHGLRQKVGCILARKRKGLRNGTSAFLGDWLCWTSVGCLFDFVSREGAVGTWFDANGECALVGQTQGGKFALVYVAGREEFLQHRFDPTDPGDGFYIHDCHLRFEPTALAPRSSNIELGQLLVAANRVSILTHTGLDRLLFVGLMTKPLREGWSIVSENPDGKPTTLFQYGHEQDATS